MIYTFTLTSDENDLFKRQIEIAEDDTFLNLHKAISAACNFVDGEMASFFVTNSNWDNLQEITLIDMGTEDAVSMDTTKINEYIKGDITMLSYQFDFLGNRSILCCLEKTSEKKCRTKYPRCVLSEGNAPLQKFDDTENEIDALFNDTDLDEEDPIFDQESSDELGFGSELGNEYDDYNNNDY